jgi:hypothetical protein
VNIKLEFLSYATVSSLNHVLIRTFVVLHFKGCYHGNPGSSLKDWVVHDRRLKQAWLSLSGCLSITKINTPWKLVLHARSRYTYLSYNGTLLHRLTFCSHRFTGNGQKTDGVHERFGNKTTSQFFHIRYIEAGTTCHTYEHEWTGNHLSLVPCLRGLRRSPPSRRTRLHVTVQ